MAKKIRKQVKGKFDESKVKLPGEGTGTMTRKAGRLEAAGIDTKSLIVMVLVGAGLLAMLIGTIRAGNRREENRKQQVVWETQCQQECTVDDQSEAEIRRCVDRCVAGKEKDAAE
jgi:hypothetical protein